MLVVGLTGGIGSGKTYIAELFKTLNIPVYNSDEKAKLLMHNNNTIRCELTNRFGADAYVNGELNRAFIANKVFENQTELKWLNSVVHPQVANDFNQWKNENINAPYVIKEAAILIESGAYKTCNQIILVKAPLELRIKRVIKRDNLNEKQIMDRINNQMTDNVRLKYANFVIENNGTNDVVKQIEKIHNTLINIEK